MPCKVYRNYRYARKEDDKTPQDTSISNQSSASFEQRETASSNGLAKPAIVDMIRFTVPRKLSHPVFGTIN